MGNPSSPILFVGATTNGEWNTLRSKGRTRPLSVLQIRANVRAKFSRMGVRKMQGMLTPVGRSIILVTTFFLASNLVN